MYKCMTSEEIETLTDLLGRFKEEIFLKPIKPDDWRYDNKGKAQVDPHHSYMRLDIDVSVDKLLPILKNNIKLYTDREETLRQWKDWDKLHSCWYRLFASLAVVVQKSVGCLTTLLSSITNLTSPAQLKAGFKWTIADWV